ncbi:MAG TPA: DPP IV N-terminal domain-containing protein [Candidatus Acidoferrales bacterium]|nr:DPP IV N-terminal domain-containing protein [Candidatus Acidoferrales bacterium]
MTLRQRQSAIIGLAILTGIIAAAVPCAGQKNVAYAPHALGSADYARAENFLPYNTTRLVYRTVQPTWMADGRFWYRQTTAEGSEFVAVDPARGTRAPLFDHAKLAAALSAAAKKNYEARHLPFRSCELSSDQRTLTFTIGKMKWACDLQSNECKGTENPQPPSGPPFGRGATRNPALSPDGKYLAFIRDYNLWVRDVASGRETQLTTDGVKDFGYATDNAGWIHSDRPVLLWSPDSKKLATYQQDQRGVGEMYLVETRVGHPILQEWKYPLPGDPVITTIQRVIIDLDGSRVVRLQMTPDQHRSSLCDDVACTPGTLSDAEWSQDSSHLAFLSTSRDHKQENLRIADAATGEVRDVLEEKVKTFFESGNGAINWRYLPQSNEVAWFSERSDWGQLYLYDLSTGEMKNQITSGEGNVTNLLRVDEKNRMLYLLAVGKEKGRNPYYQHLYRIGFDGKNMQLLTPENANHDVTMSPNGEYFVDSYSTPEESPVTVLRDSSGKLLQTIEKVDISRLVATGWKPPMQFTVKARDGETDLYGLLFRPTNFDPRKKYPFINHIYPGPQTGSVGSRSFEASRGDAQSLAELGFIVVEIDGMGTPWRSKKFHEAYFGDMGDNTLPDQVTGMKQLAERYPWIDIERAGIYGHSGGGYATADAMFRYPDFFKVGISESGNHDNREYEDDWAEKWQGLLVKNADGTTNYDNQANELIAMNLKGHLLLAHGTIDDNVPPYNTFLVVDALIKANKDFDLLLLPNEHHGYADDSNYMTRRRWDYFVRYLLGAEPPHEYQMHPAPEAGR